jgi:hypothetical protein
MRCFSWNTEGTCADLLAKLPPLEGSRAILDSRFYRITDPADETEYIVLVYDRDELIPVTYTEAKAKRDFLALINTIVLPCGIGD